MYRPIMESHGWLPRALWIVLGLGQIRGVMPLPPYGVADSPSQVGGIRAEIAHAAAKPVQHRPQSIDVGYTAVRHDVIKYRPGAYVGYAVDLDLYRRIKVRDHSSGKPRIGHPIRTRLVLQRKVH